MTPKNNYVFKIGSSAQTKSDAEMLQKPESTSKRTGRPLKPVDRCKTRYVKVFCTEEDYSDFQKYCEEQKSSGSEILYRYLRRIIRYQKKLL